jgi:glutaconate CoA-transferase subunit A
MMTDLIAARHRRFLKVDPDGYREWVRDHKNRAMVPKLMSEKEAIEKLVADGDYLVYECNYLQRGPSALIREVIRQQKKDLWLGAKFTWVAAAPAGRRRLRLEARRRLLPLRAVVEQAIREGR